MYCGTPGRTPPRRPAFVGRLILFVLPLLLALTVWAAPASAYPCVSDAKRAVSGPAARAGAKQCEPAQPLAKRRNADPLSFVFFIGIIVAVLLVPITVRRREDVSPQ
jgi:hypothetical protein